MREQNIVYEKIIQMQQHHFSKQIMKLKKCKTQTV